MQQLRVLFIGTNDLSGMSGGSICSMRNFDVLKRIFGADNVTHYLLPAETRSTVLDKAKYYLSMIFRKSVYKRLRLNPEQIMAHDIVYIDNAYVAGCIGDIRRKGFRGKIIVFFHNCEYDFRLQDIGHVAGWKFWLHKRVVMHNERMALATADGCVFLTMRDYNREKAVYGMEPKEYVICPITMPDTYNSSSPALQKEPHDKPIYTFVGSYFGPNIHALQWFVTNVLPYVNIRLRIVGKNMDRLRNDVDVTGIEIYSSVQEVTPYIIDSDYMLFPIFEGSGMKVKTCEALMYGKNIVGTPEAFEGYEIGDYSKVGACCADDKQFIAAINTLNMPAFNPYSRQLFLSGYSNHSAERQFKQLVEALYIIV